MDTNTRGAGNWTGLMGAVMWEEEEVVELLLAQAAIDINLRSDGGYTALHFACRFSISRVVRWLLAVPGWKWSTGVWEGGLP